MMQIESVFFRMAETVDQDVLIICDRGTMDASACKFITFTFLLHNIFVSLANSFQCCNYYFLPK